MRRILLTAAAGLSAGLLAIACTDRREAPTAPESIAALRRSAGSVGTCTNYTALTNLVNQVFGAGSPNANSALGKLDNLQKKLDKGMIVDAVAQANNLISFIQQKAATLPGGQYANLLIASLQCYVGITDATYLVMPSDQPQVIKTADGQGGIKLDANPVSEPTLVTLTWLNPNGPAPLNTKLDQYPGYLDVTQQSGVTNSLVKPAVIAVCPSVSMPDSIRARLRLGHQATSGFEITPHADGSFLTCTAPAVAKAMEHGPKWLRELASYVLPKVAYARQFDLVASGVGGSATEYSPFDAIDPVLSVASGVGGSATEYQRVPTTTDTNTTTTRKPKGTLKTESAPESATSARKTKSEVATNITYCDQATVGTAIDIGCRPQVTVKTVKGTIFNNVPVTFRVIAGGGQTAVDDSLTRACGTFGETATGKTNVNGKVGACWTVGWTAGVNTLVATPGHGGDATMADITFSPSTATWNVMATKITPTATITGGNWTYDGQPHAATASCSNGLVPAVSYTPGTGVPTAAGSYTATVNCGGDATYELATSTASITIGKIVPTMSISCADATYDGTAKATCTATATAADLALTPSISYTDNVNAGTVTATASVVAGANNADASATATFQIAKAVSATGITCPASATYTGSALELCSASVTGAGTVTGSATLAYTNNINVGAASVTATYAGDVNHTGSTATGGFTITKASSTTTVSCPASATYTGGALTPCSANVSGAGTVTGAATLAYANNTDAGAATVSASYAGDANHDASSANGAFTILKANTTTTLSCPASVAYTGSAQTPCSASVTGANLSASVPVAYANNTTAGSASANASYVGGANWNASSASGGFAITKLAATAKSGSATINFGSAVPTIPCTISGLLSGDAGAVTCTSSVPAVTQAGSFTVTPVWSPANPLNYAMSGIPGTLTVVGYTQVGCFSSPVYWPSMPDSKSAQRKGSNLPLKCGLVNAQGVAVTTATGNLRVEDRGTDATLAPGVVDNAPLIVSNAFKYSSGGNYAYGLDTSPAKFVAGHYYYVYAKWNDGSETKGWFLLK